MTQFLRLLAEPDKAAALLEVCGKQRAAGSGQNPEGHDPRIFEVAPESFDAVPGKPFAYWVSEAIRETFRRLPAFESEGRQAQRALSTNNDFRYIRIWWERDKDFQKPGLHQAGCLSQKGAHSRLITLTFIYW